MYVFVIIDEEGDRIVTNTNFDAKVNVQTNPSYR